MYKAGLAGPVIEGTYIPEGGRLGVKGQVSFRNVRFVYASDTNKVILDEFDLDLEAGQVSKRHTHSTRTSTRSRI